MLILLVPSGTDVLDECLIVFRTDVGIPELNYFLVLLRAISSRKDKVKDLLRIVKFDSCLVEL